MSSDQSETQTVLRDTGENDRSLLNKSEIDHTHAPKQIEQRSSWHDIIVTCSTFIMGMFTVALWWTSSEQLGQIKEQTKAMQDQLVEIRNGSNDTKTIAEAAKIQAENTNRMAEAAGEQLGQIKEQTKAMQAQLVEMRNGSKDTKAIAGAARIQADNTNRMAEAANQQLGQIKEQTKVMQNQLREITNGSIDTKTIAEAARTQADNTNKMAEAAIEQVQELKANVRIAQEANNSTRDALILDKRAWVGIKSMRIQTFEVGRPVDVVMVLTNSGKTFARQVVTVAHKATGRKDVVLDFDQMAKLLPAKPEQPKVLFPNLTVSVTPSTSYNLSESQFAAIKNHEQIFYIFGQITYTDVFNENRVTEFCGMYDGNNPELYLCDQHQRAT